MRSLWTAMTPLRVWCVFAGLTGCNYDNPGFKVKGSAEGSGASETSVSVSVSVGDVTSDTGVSSAVPTTSEDPTATTTGEPGTSSSTTIGVSETSSGDAESSTGMQPPPVFPLQCNEGEKTAVQFPVAADTYFLFNINDPGQCEDTDVKCAVTNAGKKPFFYVFNRDDYLSVFAVRFATEPLKYMGFPVPPEAVSLKLRVFVDRMDNQHPNDVLLDPLRIDPKDADWPEGDNPQLGPCQVGDSSFACRRCDVDTTCAEDWSTPMTTILMGKASLVGAPIVVSKSYSMLAEVVLDAKAELPLFAQGHPGFLISGQSPVFEQTLVVKAHESGEMYAPQLIAEYCTPKP